MLKRLPMDELSEGVEDPVRAFFVILDQKRLSALTQVVNEVGLVRVLVILVFFADVCPDFVTLNQRCLDGLQMLFH